MATPGLPPAQDPAHAQREIGIVLHGAKALAGALLVLSSGGVALAASVPPGPLGPGPRLWPAQATGPGAPRPDPGAEMRRRAEEAARVRRPQAVSAAHSGELTPVGVAPAALVAGRTLTLQAPIVQGGRLLRVDTTPVYFAPDGLAHSVLWVDRPWRAEGDDLCLGPARGQAPTCMTPMRDATGQAFLRGREDRRLVQVGRIGPATRVRPAS